MKSFKEFLTEIINENPESRRKLQSKHKELMNHYQYEPEEIKNIKDYTTKTHEGSGSARLNSYLWRKHHDKSEHDELYEKRKQNLDKIMKMHKTPEEMHVYSGITYDPRNKMNSEGIVHHPAYLSTSLNREVARTFNRWDNDSKQFNMLKIHVPKNHPGIYVGNHTKWKSEKELILPRGINLKHIKSEKSGPSPFNCLHHMEIV
jgi:hypothetical protein